MVWITWGDIMYELIDELERFCNRSIAASKANNDAHVVRTLAEEIEGFIRRNIDRILHDLYEGEEEFDDKHYVDLADGSFAIIHSLRCRAQGDMINCSYMKMMQGHRGEHLNPGRYRISINKSDRDKHQLYFSKVTTKNTLEDYK